MTNLSNVSDASDSDSSVLDLTAQIVAAYVSNNPVQVSALSNMIKETHNVLSQLHTDVKDHGPLVPAVPIKKSVTDEFIICLEDGQKFKTLKRHLRSKYNMTPEEYREKWGLPYDYPMVAPNYAKKRSSLAKEMGLGRGN